MKVADSYTAEQAHAAVARGAKWLDKQCPAWPTEINLKKLDLGNAGVCVLGQTAPCLLAGGDKTYPLDYFGVLRRFGRNSDLWAERKGFLAFIGKTGSWVSFEMLTIAWKELIRERLAAQL